nr:DUF4097 family beta strand repeat-containing protein [Actinomadura coerulea]
MRGGSSKMTLHREVKYRGDKPDGPTHQIENGVLTLRGCGSDCSVSYTVELPAGVPVSGSTSNGSITLSKVGKVDVSTHSGSVRLDGAAGPVKVRTDNGEVTVTMPAGRYRVSTHTGDGDRRLGIPNDPSAEFRLDVSTSNGDITTRTA